MKRHETLHLGAPKPRRLSQSRSMRKFSGTSRRTSGAAEKGGSFSNHSKPNHVGTIDEQRLVKSPLSDATDHSKELAEYFPAFMPDHALQDLGTDLGDLGNLDPSQMSSTNWLPPAPSDQLSLDPFNVLLDQQQPWPMTSPRLESSASTATSPLDAIPQQITFPGAPDTPLAQNFSSQLKRIPSAEALGGESPRSFSSLESDRVSQAPSGEFYVDGGATRLPKGRKRRTSVHSTQGMSPGYGSHMSRLSLVPHQVNSQPLHPPNYVNSYSYGLMFEVFKQTCLQSQTSFRPFEEELFLPHQAIDDLVSLAIEHFLPTIPFIHKAKLRSQSCSWVLYLALATIGTHYELNILDERVYSMNEFLRRALAWVEGESMVEQVSDVEAAQATILSCITLLYSSNPTHERFGMAAFTSVVGFSNRDWASILASAGVSTMWEEWITQQSIIRTVYMIWLLDCIMGYQIYGHNPMHLKDPSLPLPTNDKAWFAETEEMFNWHRMSNTSDGPPLHAAMEALYIERQVDPSVGEFGQFLLIHAIIRQTWNTLDHSRSRLASWEPQATPGTVSAVGEQHDSLQSSVTELPWPPSHPHFAKWRNAACDALDVLHWQASATVGANAGLEHPTVLFLNLARVILLSPFESIREMALALSSQKSLTKHQISMTSREIARWAQEDCFKARLAIIHAGAVLWHVRRHSLDCFYEPSAVFIATLCLWAYGSVFATSGINQVGLPPAIGAHEEAEPMPELLQLDRPCDDELVQLFVTNADRIKGYVAGVGYLCSPDGPKKMLDVGCRILRFGRNWDLDGGYIRILRSVQERSNFDPRASANG